MDEDRVRQLAKRVVERKLSVPAVFFLELYKPLTGLMGAGIDITAPVLKLLFGSDVTSDVSELLSSRADVEAVIAAIEREAK